MASSAGADASIGGGGGGVETDLKRHRLLDAGGPIEDDETARQKMRDAKFDPDNVAGFKEGLVENSEMTPM